MPVHKKGVSLKHHFIQLSIMFSKLVPCIWILMTRMKPLITILWMDQRAPCTPLYSPIKSFIFLLRLVFDSTWWSHGVRSTRDRRPDKTAMAGFWKMMVPGDGTMYSKYASLPSRSIRMTDVVFSYKCLPRISVKVGIWVSNHVLWSVLVWIRVGKLYEVDERHSRCAPWINLVLFFSYGLDYHCFSD